MNIFTVDTVLGHIFLLLKLLKLPCFSETHLQKFHKTCSKITCDQSHEFHMRTRAPRVFHVILEHIIL